MEEDAGSHRSSQSAEQAWWQHALAVLRHPATPLVAFGAALAGCAAQDYRWQVKHREVHLSDLEAEWAGKGNRSRRPGGNSSSEEEEGGEGGYCSGSDGHAQRRLQRRRREQAAAAARAARQQVWAELSNPQQPLKQALDHVMRD